LRGAVLTVIGYLARESGTTLVRNAIPRSVRKRRYSPGRERVAATKGIERTNEQWLTEKPC